VGGHALIIASVNKDLGDVVNASRGGARGLIESGSNLSALALTFM
jgi:hypothetical protein